MNVIKSDNIDDQCGIPVAASRHALLLMIGSCLPVMATVVIAPVLPQLMRHFSDVPHAEVLVPLALTIPALVIGIVGLFVGAVADRFGRKRLLLAGMALYALCGTAPLYLDTLAAIIASRAGLGVAEAIVMTVCTSLIGDYFAGERRERYLVQQAIWPSFAAIFFFGLGGLLGEAGWRTPFWLYFAGLLLLPVMAAMLWEPRSDAGAAVMKADAPDARAFPVRRVAGICAVTLGGAVAFYTLPVHLGFLMNGIGITSPAKIGAVAAIGSVANMAGAVSFHRLARFGVAGSLAMAFAALGTGFLIAGGAQDFNTMLLGAVCHGFGSGIVIPAMLTWLMRQLRFEERGRGSGAFTASFFIGQFISPLIVLGLSKPLGNLGAALGGLGWVVVAAAVVAGVCAMLLRPVLRPEHLQ